MQKIQKLITKSMRDKYEQELTVFYKELIQNMTHLKVDVQVNEMSDGKYGIGVTGANKVLWIIAKAWDTSREIRMNLQNITEEFQLILKRG